VRAQPGFVPHVQTLGRGPRRVLALHCTLGHSGAWRGFVDATGAAATLTAPDMPSHGRSPDWDGHSSFADTVHAAALACLDTPMDVIGHSFGGAAALRLAVQHPELVRSATLFEPVFFHAALVDAPETVAEHDAMIAPAMTALGQGDPALAARLFNRMWSEGPRWADLPETSRAAMIRAIPVVPGETDFIMHDTEGLLPRLADCHVPVLVARGEIAYGIIRATSAGIVRRLPKAREAVIAGAGHMAPVSHPQALAELWSEFVAQV
jgi:lipase